METLLEIFSDLMILTGGIIVSVFWILVFLAIAIEIKDAFLAEQDEETLDA